MASCAERIPETLRLPALESTAETLHVDGFYAQAADLWKQFARLTEPNPGALLKAAISYLSVGSEHEGTALLTEAEGLGLAEAAACVRGQLAWRRGDAVEALHHFMSAEASGPPSSLTANALGVLWWRLRSPANALRWFEEAARRNPSDGESRLNLANYRFLQGDPPSQDLLAAAALMIPHKPEPHVLWSRVLKKGGAHAQAAQALRRAALRRMPRSQPAVPASAGVNVSVTAVIELRDDQFVVRCRVATPSRPPYLRVTINPGYQVLEPLSGMESELGPSQWRQDPSGWSLEWVLAGRPVGAGSAWTETRIELSATSAWLPQLHGAVQEHRLTWKLPETARVWWGANPCGGMDALILRKPANLYQPAGQALLAEVIGETDATGLRPAREIAAVLAGAVDYWNHLLDEARPSSAVVVVDRPRSAFCYTRSGYVRAASGALHADSSLDLLRHEAGHFWWGLEASTSQQHQWISEGLAEWVFHSHDSPARTLYRRGVIDRLSRSIRAGDLPPEPGLAELSADNGRARALSLREKAGYFFAMLRTLLGEETFREFLKDLRAAGNSGELNPWLVRALAAGRRGQCLHWFFAQWVDSCGFPVFGWTRVERSDKRVTFSAENRTAFSLGAPVLVELLTADCAVQRQSVNLELGSAQGEFVCEHPPVRLRIDPDRDWYAAREDYVF